MILEMSTADKTALITCFRRVARNLATMMLYQATIRQCPSTAASQTLAPARTQMSPDRKPVAAAGNKFSPDRASQTQSKKPLNAAVLCLPNKTHQKELQTMRCFWAVVKTSRFRDPSQKHQIKAPLASTPSRARRVILGQVVNVQIPTEACSFLATIIRARDLA